VLRALREPDHSNQLIGPAWLPDAARDITALGSRSVILLVVLAVLGYLGLQRRWSQVCLVAVAAAGGGAASTVLKELVGRPRPSLPSPLVIAGSPSFPSGHAMLAAAVYLTPGRLARRDRPPAPRQGLCPSMISSRQPTPSAIWRRSVRVGRSSCGSADRPDATATPTDRCCHSPANDPLQPTAVGRGGAQSFGGVAIAEAPPASRGAQG
jgi:hypothetical protein